MTHKQFTFCLSELPNYSDRDAYISDLALSSIWGDPVGAPIPLPRIEALGAIFDASCRTVPQIMAAAGLSSRELSERFQIPRRTVTHWLSGERQCPFYIRMMMQECLGLFRPGL